MADFINNLIHLTFISFYLALDLFYLNKLFIYIFSPPENSQAKVTANSFFLLISKAKAASLFFLIFRALF
jgi:uncharacterized membrane protein